MVIDVFFGAKRSSEPLPQSLRSYFDVILGGATTLRHRGTANRNTGYKIDKRCKISHSDTKCEDKRFLATSIVRKIL